MTSASYPPPLMPGPPRTVPRVADAAATVLVVAGLAALLVALVLGVRGFVLQSDGGPTADLCTTRDVSVGECRLAVADRRNVASALLGQGGAAAVGGAVLLGGGVVRSVAVRRQRTALGQG